MKYQVDWTPSAEQELAALWTSSSDRAEITTCARRLKRQLQNDPLSAGESRTGTTRILIDEPLAIVFEVVQDDWKVLVHSVWLA